MGLIVPFTVSYILVLGCVADDMQHILTRDLKSLAGTAQASSVAYGDFERILGVVVDTASPVQAEVRVC